MALLLKISASLEKLLQYAAISDYYSLDLDVCSTSTNLAMDLRPSLHCLEQYWRMRMHGDTSLRPCVRPILMCSGFSFADMKCGGSRACTSALKASLQLESVY
jgi:hypothetical protein